MKIVYSSFIFYLSSLNKVNYSKSTYYSNVFRDFRAIETEEYRRLIEYVEERKKEIRHLEFEEYFEILIAYLNALFQIGKYRQFLEFVDEAIELSVMKNVQFLHGDDIYQKLLFQKAASSFHTFELEKSDHILRELIKMNPLNRDSVFFLKKCLRRKKSTWLNNARAFSVVLFFLSALVICIEILVVRAYFTHWTTEIMAARNILFFSAWLILGFGELIHRWKVEREVNHFTKASKKRKRTD